MVIEPNQKYCFSEPFASELIRSIETREAREAARARGEIIVTAILGEPVTDKQERFLIHKGVPVPATKAEASAIIGKIKAREARR